MADEPTGNLDSARTEEVLALMRQFNRERGQTFILVTHDAEVGAACDRIIRMRGGPRRSGRAGRGRGRDRTQARRGPGAPPTPPDDASQQH